MNKKGRMTINQIFGTMNHMNSRSYRVVAGFFICCFFMVGMAIFGMELVNAATQASATPAQTGGALYTPRYLPPIVQGAQGPGDLVFLIYKYLMGIVGIVAVGVIIYGGVLRTISADAGKIKASNEYIKNAIKGIVLLFGAQVLFNTINPNIIDIARIQRALQPTEKITPKQFTEVNIELTDEEAAAGAQEWADEGVIERARFGGRVISEENAVERLKAIGGGVAVKGCENGLVASCMCTGEQRAAGKKADGSGCVSFMGAQDKTMKEIVGLGKTLGSSVIVTSVTDGHGVAGLTGSAHNTGDKFDLRPLPAVTNYIKANFVKIESVPDWKDKTKMLERYKNPITGSVYTFEPTLGTRGAHWDIDTRPSAPPAAEG